MEPNTHRLIWEKPFANADELNDLLCDAAVDANTSLDLIAVDACGDGDRCGKKSGIAIFEAEALSDGSVVYNITLH